MLKILPPKKTSRQMMEEWIHKIWSEHPDLFNPHRNCRELDRIDKTWDLIRQIPSLSEKKVIDIGCGTGELALRLKNAGAIVHVLEGSRLPLEKFSNQQIQTFQDCLPKTRLEDDFYDIVICTDVLAYLPPQDHRLLMLELSRIVKKDGYVICSTALDIHSEEPIEIFQSLLNTEFIIENTILSYHSMHIKIRDILEAPRRLIQNRICSKALVFVLNPLAQLFRYNRKLLLGCETINKIFNSDAGISHAICICKRKPLF
jgi:2-polyprenyl-3-methyl-5-hydroxy-6-metoxy-1,4-benzoquinol methylase